MAYYFLCLCLMRIVLPFTLTISVLFRYSGLSLIYLILLLLLPRLSVPTNKSMAGATGKYLRCTIVISMVTSIAQFCFQVVLLSTDISDSNTTRLIMLHIGFVHTTGIRLVDGIRYIGPEVLVLVSSITVYVTCKKLASKTHTQKDYRNSEANVRYKWFFFLLGNCLTLISFCVTSILCPSVLSAFYFLMFLIGMTMWACHRDMKRISMVLNCIMVIITAHVIALFCVQMQFIQEYLEPYHKHCRYLGFVHFIDIKHSDPRELHFVNYNWIIYLHPVTLLWLNYIVGIQSHFFKQSQRNISKAISSISYHKRSAAKMSPATSVHQLFRELKELKNKISLSQLKAKTTYKLGIWDHLLDVIYDLVDIITHSSHVGTNIIMMVWSISFHSWLTFIWLLWACLLWIVPNQRLYTLRCSPFLLAYAILLLLCQYLYSMNLTEDELPRKTKGINLEQIGLSRPVGLPCIPLLIMSSYTLFFWINLYQYIQENYERKKTNLVENSSSTLHNINSSNRSQLSGVHIDKKYRSTVTISMSSFLKRLLVKYWIYIVIGMLLTSGGVIGNVTHITVNHIIYMVLFLIFTFTFRLSFHIWHKFLLSFWLVLIFVAMTTLVEIYTYQFDPLPYVWEHYLHIPLELQHDFGLEIFKTKYLFIKLLVPVLLLMVTAIQLHYFHKDFMILTWNISHLRLPSSSSHDSDFSQHMKEKKHTRRFSFRRDELSLNRIKHLTKEIILNTEEIINMMWLFLEQHMQKMMMLAILIMCVFDTCAVNLLFLSVAIISLSFCNWSPKIVTEVVSMLISVLLVFMMIYQFKYFRHEDSIVKCEGNTTRNIAGWLGFYKNTPSKPFQKTSMPYIILIVLATFNALVMVRQRNKRGQSSETYIPQQVMFPKIERKDADNDLLSAIKYLLNYGFFKFGVEVCFLMSMILIASRMDMYALMHLMWLCTLTFMTRRNQFKLWNAYQFFIVITIFIQYAIIVGLPPSLCVEYPWSKSLELEQLQQWMFLPDPDNSPSSYKLIYDFILLMLVFRQNIMFQKEKHFKKIYYPGGSNDDIYPEAEQPGFVNPVPNHISYTRSWLDFIKRCVLSCFTWFIVILLFMAGANQMTFFSLGYMVFAFKLLWQGNKMFLYPVSYILKQWNIVLVYCFVVVMFKTWRQIFVILFYRAMTTRACWVAKLFHFIYIKKLDTRQESVSSEEIIACKISRNSSIQTWDTACYIALIFMMRFCKSYYFIHHVNNVKAMTYLTSRGMELIENITLNYKHKQEEEETKILSKINKITEWLEATHKKSETKYKEPESHETAVRVGDYYLFEEEEEEELLEQKPSYENNRVTFGKQSLLEENGDSRNDR